jgi:dTDP-4-amino-4,6-dideoxygalactose transaminase
MKKDDNSLEYIYDVVDIGFDYSMSQLNAAYIRAQIKEQDKNLKRLKEISKKYTESLNGVNHITTPQNCSKEHPYTLYIVKIDKNRDSFALELQKKGVNVGLHYIPLHFLSYYKNKYSLKINNFPTALTCYQQFMSLPIYPSMSDKEVAFVIKKVKSVSSTRV